MTSRDPIRQLQSQTLATLVADRLERKVVEGTLAAGARLNEVALAAELGVSRGPVRESIRILERKGLVKVVANRGAFVREVDANDMLDLYRIRAAMTGLACELAGERVDASAVASLRGLLERMDAAVAAADQSGYYASNLAFHAQLVEASGSDRLRAINDQLVTQAHLFRRGSLARMIDMRRSNDEHRRIVDAIEAGDVGRARVLGAAHVDAGRGRFLESLRVTPVVVSGD